MKRGQRAFAVIAAVLLAGVGLVLATAGVGRRAALASTQTRLVELRAQRLDPRDADIMKRALAAATDAQTGLQTANDAEAAPRLEAVIRSAAQGHDAEIQSISLAADTTSPTLPVVRGNLHLVISDERTGSFLKSLESGSPAVFLERLRISHRPSIENDRQAFMLDLTASILVYLDIPAAGKSMP
ncbi:MAG: hypothetical protein K0S56_1776 [Microvirga sp.]|jgi:hypothetical protein|nr:hypothetical protein [Microvirga sp.]